MAKQLARERPLVSVWDLLPGRFGLCLLSPRERLLSSFPCYENIRGKLESGAQFSYLLKCEPSLASQEHRNRALGPKFRNQITLSQALLFNKKPQNGDRVRFGKGVVRLFITIHSRVRSSIA